MGQTRRVRDLDPTVGEADEALALEIPEHLVQGWPAHAEQGGEGFLRSFRWLNSATWR
jgi:hypothetical protein